MAASKKQTKPSLGLSHPVHYIATGYVNRHSSDAECPALEWRFLRPPNDPKAYVTWKRINARDEFRRCIEEGLILIIILGFGFESVGKGRIKQLLPSNIKTTR